MAHRKIEYVFGPPRPSTGHSLGVSTLALSSDIQLVPNSYGTLFTGGRDGRINAWGLTLESSNNGTEAARVSDLHTNWVSDLQVLSNSSVVSCSADTTVKLWNVESNNTVTVGHHKDYAQCLSKLSANTIVSGGLDERILGWNVERPGGSPLFDIKTGHSVYALATAAPNLIVGGFPDGAVRIWDTRQRGDAYIAKFTGHTDSVRSLFVTGGDTVVSGSSDASVRVWSLRTGRVIKTLNQFNSSVWALTPANTQQRSDSFVPSSGDIASRGGFFAGDRSGNIYYTDRLDKEPQIVVENAVSEGGLKGICVDPVTSNAWVSTPFTPDLKCINLQSGNEVKRIKGHRGLRRHRLINDKRRALVVDTAGDVAMVDLVSAKQLDFHRYIDVSKGQNIDQELDDILEEVNTMDVLDNWCQVQTRAGQICVVLDSRSINNAEVYLDDLVDHVSATPKTPAASPLASPLGTPVGSGFFRQGRSSLTSPAVSRVPSSQSFAELAMLEQKQKLKLGTGKGNAKFYDPDEEEEQKSNASRNGINSAKPAAAPGLQAPKITTTAPQSAGADAEQNVDSETADDEIRINLGNYVLENLLRGVLGRLKREYEALPEPPAAKSVNRSTSADHESHTEANTKPAPPQADGKSERKRTKFLKMFGLGKNKEEETPTSSRNLTPVQTGNGDSSSNKDSQENPQLVKQRIQQQHQNDPESASFKEAWSVAVANRSLQSADPEAPEPSVLSRRTRLVVTEIAPGAGAPTEIYSTTVGKLIDNKTEAEKIEAILPGWVGDAVLLGRLNMKQPTKIGFAVVSEEQGMPELTPDNTRLMAIAMLRTRKIMAYTVGQLQQHNILSGEASNHPPEELISLSCCDTELTAHTTLATIRTRIWRKGGDVILNYNLKKRI